MLYCLVRPAATKPVPSTLHKAYSPCVLLIWHCFMDNSSVMVSIYVFYMLFFNLCTSGLLVDEQIALASPRPHILRDWGALGNWFSLNRNFDWYLCFRNRPVLLGWSGHEIAFLPARPVVNLRNHLSHLCAVAVKILYRTKRTSTWGERC